MEVEENPDVTFEIKVSGLPFTVEEDNLESEFKKFGKLASVKLLRRPDGSSRGLAFIKYFTEDAANKSLSLSESEF